MTTQVVTDELLGKFAERKHFLEERLLDFDQTYLALQKLIEGKRLIENLASNSVPLLSKRLTDAQQGRLSRRTHELQTRLVKGAIDYYDTMYGLKLLSQGKPVIEASISNSDLAMQLIRWRDFYREIFQMEVSFFGQKIPPKKEGLNRILAQPQGIKLESIFSKCLCHEFYIEGFQRDVGELAKQFDSVRSAKNSVSIVWTSESNEADMPLSGTQDFDYTKDGPGFITLEERLLADLENKFRTGEFLDNHSATVCLGSRSSTGQTPLVLAIDWGSRVQVVCGSDYYCCYVTRLNTRRVQS